MKIPNQNNIDEILKSSIESTDKIIKTAKLLVVSVNQNIIDKSEIDNLKVGFQNTVECINLISSMIFDIYQAMTELNYALKSINISMVLENPINLVKFIKSGNTEDLESNNLGNNNFIAKVMQIMNLSKILSDYGANIKVRHVKKVKKIAIKTIDVILDIYKYVVNNFIKSKIFDLTSPIFKTILDSVKNMVKILGEVLDEVKEFVLKNNVDRKQIKNAIKSIFSIQTLFLRELFIFGIKLKFYNIKKLVKPLLVFISMTFILSEIFERLKVVIENLKNLGENRKVIENGITLLYYFFNRNKTLKNKFFNQKSLLEVFDSYTIEEIIRFSTNLFLYKKIIIPQLVSIFALLSNTIDILIKIGENSNKIDKSLYIVHLMFGKREKGIKSGRSFFKYYLLECFSDITINDVKKLSLAISISLMYSIIFPLLSNVFNILSFAGSKNRQIRRGIKVVDLLFNNQNILFFKNKRKSLLSIFTTLTPDIIPKLGKAIIITVILTTLVSLFAIIFHQLIHAGKNYLKIKFGIKILNYLSRNIEDIIKNVNKIKYNDILESTLKMILISKSIYVFSAALVLLGISGLLAPAAIVAVIAIITIVKLYLFLLSIVSKASGNLDDEILELTIIGASLLALAEIVQNISELNLTKDKIKNVLSFLGISLIIFATFSLISYILSFLSVSAILKTAAFLIPVALSLLVISNILEKISEYHADYENMLDFVISLTIIVGVALLFSLISFALPFALIGVTLFSLIITMIFVVAIELIALNQINIGDIEKAKTKIKIIFGVCKDIINSFLEEIIDLNPSGDAWYTTAVKAIFGPLGAIITVILAFSIVAISLLIITMIIILAGELLIIQKISLDEEKIKSVVSSIFKTIDFILSMLFGGSENPEKSNENESIWEKLFTIVLGPIGSLIKAIFTMAYVAMAVITISCVLFIAFELKLLESINLDKVKIRKNVSKIIGTIDFLNSTLTKQREKPKSKDTPWYKKVLNKIPIFSSLTSLMDGISNMSTVAMAMISIGMISCIATNLETIQKINLDEKIIKTKTNKILRICNDLSSSLSDDTNMSFDEDKIELFGDYTDSLSILIKSINELDIEKVDPFTKLYNIKISNLSSVSKFTIEILKMSTSLNSLKVKKVDKYIKFIDKANSIDVEKIKSIRDMFEQMSRFNESIKGDFDKLADILSDKLIVVLEKLQETISGIPTNVSVNQKIASQNISTDTITPNTQTKQQTQVNTTQKNNDKINKNLMDIKDSLDDMISLLTSVKNNTENYNVF